MIWIKKNIVQIVIMLVTVAILARCVGAAVILNTLGDAENLTLVDDLLFFAILVEVLLFIILSLKFWRRAIVILVLGLCCSALTLVFISVSDRYERGIYTNFDTKLSGVK